MTNNIDKYRNNLILQLRKAIMRNCMKMMNKIAKKEKLFCLLVALCFIHW